MQGSPRGAKQVYKPPETEEADPSAAANIDTSIATGTHKVTSNPAPVATLVESSMKAAVPAAPDQTAGAAVDEDVQVLMAANESIRRLRHGSRGTLHTPPVRAPKTDGMTEMDGGLRGSELSQVSRYMCNLDVS